MTYARSLLFTLLATASAAQLPYNPTTIIAPANSTSVYIYDSTSFSNGSTQVITLDLSLGLSSTSIDNAAKRSVPWEGSAYTIAQSSDGTLFVLAGDCANEASTQLWRSARAGEWTQGTVSGEQAVQYLSRMFAPVPSGAVVTSTDIYSFGGMCPDTGNGNDSWTADASYTASMDRLSLILGTGNGYSSSTVASSGGPVAEAGFTLTALPRSSISQQQFVLIGGHTQTAFINMSQAAIFTTPQESWSFIPLQQPQNDTIEPRSGHTTVFSQDGTKVIVYGGWVGDVSTPAQPQLAVLEIESTFGSTAQWQWTVPTTTGASATGVFGHGAAMLSGDVMLVYGGYDIPAGSSMAKRATLTSQTQLRMLNITSNTWISDYTLPAGSIVPAGPSTGSDIDTKQRIGLAVGLTMGLLILLGLVFFYFWYTRRNKRRQLETERNLMSRSSDGSYNHISQPFLEKNSIDGRGGDFAALSHYWAGPGSAKDAQMAQKSATTGMFMDNPSPTRGLRKGAPSRNYQYHAAPRYDEKRASRHSGNIHPIAELDEDSQSRISKDGHLTEAERQLKEVEAILNSTRTPIRQVTPVNPLRSNPVSPETGERSVAGPSIARPSSPNWTSEPVSGRASPTKTDDRTSSSLSEQSHRSMFSDNSITRTMSTRTGTLLAAAAAAHVRAKAVEAEASSSSGGSRSNTMSTTGRTSPVSRRTIARSSTNGSSRGADSRMGGVYAESFRTARSNTTYDGDVLLNGPVLDRDDPYRRAFAAGDLISRNRRGQGILGSLRKAIGAIASPVQRGGSEYDQLQSTNSSPIKERRNPMESPRRTVSDGGALLRQKRGREDWADNAWPPYRDDPDPGDWGERIRTSTEKQQAEEEWDVEDAAAKRDVQIMFTVPKSRLRVVNADMDRASLRSVSDGALSRAGSLRVLKREESKTLLAPVDRMTSMPEVETEDKAKLL